jgi:CIC family chloride channel protein
VSGEPRWQRIRDGRLGQVGLAVLIGAGAGLAAVVFRWLITRATRLFTSYADYSSVGPHGHPAHHWLPWLGPWFVVAAPVLGGLLYGPVVYRFAREARGHGVPEVMLAVARRGGRIPRKVAVVKALASAICIGSGGSVGREGPIVQIGSALASRIGTTLRLPEARLRILVACGAAGGIAATFNAPLAGVFFALELLLVDFAAESFGLVVLAAVTASVVGRSMLGNEAFLHLPAFTLRDPWEYVFYALLGLVAGVVGVGFTRVLYAVEDLCDWAWRGPEWARPAVGGVLLGGLLLVLPQMYGVGYPVLQAGVAGRYAVGFLIVLLLGKMLATSLTIGIGGSGGVFAPSLFCGAMLGAAFGDVLGHVAPGIAGPVGAYAVVGMGALFAGAARAPITAVLMLFELSGEYTIILPLMLAIVLATATSKALSADTVYTLKLRRRGIDLDASPGDRRLTSARVHDVLEPAPPVLAAHDSLTRAAELASRGGHLALPVVADGRLLGLVTARALAGSLADEQTPGTPRTVDDLTERPPMVTAGMTLDQAMPVLAAGGDGGTPVTDEHEQLLGWLSPRAVLTALSAPTRSVPLHGSDGQSPSVATSEASGSPAADANSSRPARIC